MKNYIINTLSVSLIIFLLSVQVMAVPPMPMEFFGSVFLDGNPAPVGTVISAHVNGVEKGNITTTINGFYGGPGIFDYRLKVFLTEEEYRPGEVKIVFMINGWQAGQIVDYEPGKSTQLDLSSGSGTNQPQAIVTANTTIAPLQQPVLDSSNSGSSSSTSTITYGLDQSHTFKSDDGLAEILFEKDTMLFSPDGQFLNVVGIRPRNISDLPPFPINENLQFSGYAYEIIPEATYFNPKGVLSFKPPSERAYELINSGPVIYEYLPQTASWEPVNTASNMFSNTISADIYEAAIYGLFIPIGQNVSTGTINGTTVAVPASISYPVTNQSIPNPPVPPSNTESVSMPIITPQALITPSDIITPLPSIIPIDTAVPIEQITTSEPTHNETSPVVTQTKHGVNPIKIPGLSILSAIVSGIQSRLSGPVLSVLGFICLLVMANIFVYAVYRFWWQKREKNG